MTRRASRAALAQPPPDWLGTRIGPRVGDNTVDVDELPLGIKGQTSRAGVSTGMSRSRPAARTTCRPAGSARLSTVQGRSWRRRISARAHRRSEPVRHRLRREHRRPAQRACRSLKLFKVPSDCIAITALSPDSRTSRRSIRAGRDEYRRRPREVKAGTLPYALGRIIARTATTYKPDNLSQNENVIDPIAGLFPTRTAAAISTSKRSTESC